MRKIPTQAALVLAFILVLFTSAQAQVVKVDTITHWKKAFKAGLNLNQATFSSNWKAGGVNSIGFTAMLNYKANYKKDKVSWDNEIDLSYGMVNNQGQGYRKTIDRIFLDTKYGHSLSEHWDLSASANFQSQFAGGYTYIKDANGVEQPKLISDILAPAYITAALGFEYHPADYFKLRLSPFSPRLTIVKEVGSYYDPVTNPTPFGVNPNESTRFQWLAFQMLAEYNKDIAENINLKWRYILFMDYEKIDVNKIDHRLDLNLTAKVNKFVNVSLGGILMYFYAQDKDVQLSQALSLGVMYTFQNYEEKK
ncbi:MAG: DUF3078 domain-containing protein [Bacteroidetes bacterium]|nr:DUF3078 domain-containing protein [Bacteroidota bacterium]